MGAVQADNIYINFKEVVSSTKNAGVETHTYIVKAVISITNNRGTNITVDSARAIYWPDGPNGLGDSTYFYLKDYADYYSIPEGEVHPEYVIAPGATMEIVFDQKKEYVGFDRHIDDFVEGSPLEGAVRFVELPNASYFNANFATVSSQPWQYPQNTGYKAWSDLEEYYLDTNEPTGVTKPNDSTDPDYVAPEYNITSCPLP